jgi:multiple sugar transport system substrate-binding protein
MTRINRRDILKAGAATGVLGVMTPALAQNPVSMTLATWGGPAEIAGFNRIIEKYKAVRPNVSIKLEIVPAGQFYQQLDTRLAGRQAPDIFRAQYQQIGRYAQNAAAIDLSKYLASGFGDAFLPSVWKAVSYQGRIHALPHHTDTFALFYNADAMEKLNIAVPTSLGQSWTWDEFIKVARLMKEKAGFPYAFAMNWQNSNAYRWLMFLYQHGGQLLDADLKNPTINSKAGIETIAWTQNWFKEGLVPPNTSLKSSEPTQNLFATGKIGMLLHGDWQIPFIHEQAKFKWGVTYMPRDVALASDLGGNALAVTRDAKNPEEAAEFVKFAINEENMADFVGKAQLLAVRKSLVESGVTFDLRPDAMKIFTRQAHTVPEHLVSTVVMPTWGRFNARLTDELELAFTSGQTPEVTAANIEKHVRSTLLV